jgi:hypothetical protein
MRGFMDDEGRALALPRAVEGDEADVGVGVLSPALLELPEHLPPRRRTRTWAASTASSTGRRSTPASGCCSGGYPRPGTSHFATIFTWPHDLT